jgi:hypothetical protein
MVVLSLVVVAFSLVPFVPPRLGLSAVISWRLASGLFLGAAAACLWQAVRDFFAVRAAGVPSPSGAVPRLAVILGGPCIAVLLLAANTVGLFPPAAASGVYTVALLLYLLTAGVLFVALLFSRLGRPAA